MSKTCVFGVGGSVSLPMPICRNIQASSSDYMSDGSARHWSREQAVGPAATATEGFLY